MIKIPVKEGQSLLDIAVRYYGSPEHITQIVKDNPAIGYNSNIGATTTLNIDDTFEGREDVIAFFKAEESEERPNVNWTEGNTGDYNDDHNEDYDI